MRQQRLRDSAFEIREFTERGALVRAGRRGIYYPILHAEPLVGNEAVLGLDLGSESARRAAIEWARDTGRNACTRLLALVQDQELASGFLMIQPVYSKGVAPANSMERRARFEGVVVGVLHLDDLIEGALGGLDRRGVQVRFTEATGMKSEELLYASAQGNVDWAEPTAVWSRAVNAGGRDWGLTFLAGPEFYHSRRLLPWLLLGLGLCTTFLLAGRVLAAARLSQQIRDSNDQLRRALGSEEQAARESQLLDSITQRINDGRDLTDILDYLFGAFHSIVPFDRIGFALLKREGQIVQSIWAKTTAPELRLPTTYRASTRDTSLQQVLDSGEPRVLNDLPGYLRSRPESRATQLLVEEGMGSSLTCPLIANGKSIGLLFFSCCRVQAYTEEHLRRFRRVARHLSVTVERALHIEELAAKNASPEEEVTRRRKAERSLSLAYERQRKPFQVGGTLHPDALSYVERDADRQLQEALLGGELCYVLTSRQMGKSSLMVRAARELKHRQVAVVMVDLTPTGQSLTTEQWYQGLIAQIGRQLQMEEELEAYWQEWRSLGPAQRLFRSLRDVVLARTRGSLVIFVDEIDAVRSLRFLYWTNGHPYLTQRLCAEVLGDPTVQSAFALDRLCDQVYLSGGAQEEDSNLAYVRVALRRSSVCREVLAAYGSER